nr:WD repeat containing protein 74 [Hymenolepis microstoma]
MVCGGRDVLFSVWDLEKPVAPIFTAKNVRPDTLDLKVPIWLSDASFVEGYDNRLFVTSSKYGDVGPIFITNHAIQFCVYDLRSNQRRPVSRSAWRVSNKQGKKSVGTGHNPAMLRDLTVTRPITRCVAYISAPGAGLRVVAANAIGDICRLDFRVPHISLVSDKEAETKKKAKSVGARAPAPPNHVLGYMPPSLGSVSALVCGGAGCANLPYAMPGANINDQPVVVSASLDRYIRVYHRDTGVLVNKIFTKAPVSTFLIRESATVPLTGNNREGVENADDCEQVDVEGGDVWDEMVTVEEPPLKRKKTIKRK